MKEIIPFFSCIVGILLLKLSLLCYVTSYLECKYKKLRENLITQYKHSVSASTLYNIEVNGGER